MPCTKHPRAQVGWACAWCHERLCADCTARRQVGATRHDVCTRCGGPAMAETRRRTDLPYLTRILDAWRFPLQGAGPWALAGVGLVLWLLNRIGGLGGLLAVGVVWACVFSAMRAVANGRATLQAPEFTDLSDDLLKPALRGFVALGVAWIPAVWYAAHVELRQPPAPVALQRQAPPPPAAPIALEQDEEREDAGEERVEPAAEAATPLAAAKPRRPLYADPVFLLIVLLGILYAPMALIMAATGGGVLDILNPVRIVAYALRIPRDYGVAVGAFIALGALSFAFDFVAERIARLPVPVLAGVGAHALAMYVPFVGARVLGLLLWVHGAALGCLPPDEAFEPVLPGVEPRGEAPEPRAEPAPATPAYERPRAISLEGVEQVPLPSEAPAAVAVFSRAPELELAAPAEPGPAARLAAAVARGDLDAAAALYRDAGELPANVLSAAGLFGVGRAAAAKGDFSTSARALKACVAAAPDDANAPRVCVMLGRIHAEKLNDPATAERVYRFVVSRYPGTEAAKFAAERLAQRPG